MSHLFRATLEIKLSWEIVGDKEAAKNWKPPAPLETKKEPLPTETDDKQQQTVDDDEEQKQNARSTRGAGSNTHYYTRHPLELLIRLPQKSSALLKLTFAFFDRLQIIGVTLGGEKNASLVDLSPSFALCNLFGEEDEGISLPVDTLVDEYVFCLVNWCF